MKRKVLLFSVLIAMMICLFAVSANAELIALDTDPGLDCDDSVVSTFDYDTFVNSTVEDKDSKIILTANGKYYVFPAYYVVYNSSSYGYSFTNLNNAIKAQDTSITSDMFTTAKTQMVRVEIIEGVTAITGTKFENYSALKEVRFPSTFTKITVMDTFGGCSNLETVSSIENFTQIGGATFTGCSKLAVDIVWPSAITSIPQRVFQNCKSIKSVTFSEGLTSVGEKAFESCDALTEIILPNTVKSVGKHAFGSCDNLKTLSFGATFTTFTSSNYDYETTQNSNALKYIYLPSSVDISGISVGYGRHIFGSDSKKNVTFFYTGDLDKATALRDKFAEIGNNKTIAEATLLKYDPTIDYTTYAETLGSSILVYDYNVCDAFYNSEHKLAETTQVSVDSYVVPFDELCVCTVCNDAQKVNDKEYAPIFVLVGYSSSYSSNDVCVSYTINDVSLKAYERITGKTLSFGVVASVCDGQNASEYAPVKADGTENYEKTVTAEISNQYAGFDFVLSGFSESSYDLAFAMCMYVSDGTDVNYVVGIDGAAMQTQYATLIEFKEFI
ncbi:MAG: leucine-rich repeat domain-containing protein [Clostridia bacterium]|nr:leucine-rich repeat domain-containing protein [Clostridia bacterium]